MTSFTSTGLLSLLHRVLQAADPALTAGLAPTDPLDRAVTPDGVKRDLVARVMDRHGPGLLLSVGLDLTPSDETPVLAVLRQNPDPAVIAQKWMRLERYMHASHRTRIDMPRPGLWTCTRHSEAAPASLGENCLIAGLLFGLIADAGLAPDRLRIGGRDLRPEGFRSAALTGTDGADFAISWRGAAPIAAPQVPDRPAQLSDRLTDLLAADPGRSWRIGDAAAQLALSRRSLQRRLAGEGRTFSTLLRRARMREAVRLLGQAGAGLAEVGYCCGYADQAHFQRDFRRAANLTPKAFRQIAASGGIGANIQ